MLDVLGSMFWRPETESDYQAALKNTTNFARASENEQTRAALMRQTGEEFWKRTFVEYDQMRMGRLAAFLRHREPDAMVGYTILIYRLTDAEVAQALYRPRARRTGLTLPAARLPRHSELVDHALAPGVGASCHAGFANLPHPLCARRQEVPGHEGLIPVQRVRAAVNHSSARMRPQS